jgi:hypothetical protein
MLFLSLRQRNKFFAPLHLYVAGVSSWSTFRQLLLLTPQILSS